MSKILLNRKNFHFATFYKFTPLRKLREFRSELMDKGNSLGLIGLILLAEEGLNSTIAGARDNIDTFLSYLKSKPGFEDMEVKYSSSTLKRMPFRKLKVKLKKEIVTMGIAGVDPPASRGNYVEPEDWNALISDPDVLLVDARNVYEYRLGSFQGAVDPRTLTFRQFPGTVKALIENRQPKKVAMFCTGGIRCEKASSYVRNLGFDQVYHLHGGILKYLETVPESESTWNGRCFVFDGRITVNHDLEAEPQPLCSTCGQVMLPKEGSDEYECIQCIEYPSQKPVKIPESCGV